MRTHTQGTCTVCDTAIYVCVCGCVRSSTHARARVYVHILRWASIRYQPHGVLLNLLIFQIESECLGRF